MKTALLALAFVVPWTGALRAQGTFQNLDFESAQLVFSDPPNDATIAATNALPGWAAFLGTNQLLSIDYNTGGGLPHGPVELVGMGDGEISGNFSVILSDYYISNRVDSITQSGLVPAGTQSLLFEVGTNFHGEPLTVSLGGQDLSYTAISNALNYTLYGADISPFAGQIGTLTFGVSVDGGSSVAELDNIQFSTMSVPEPSPISFLCLGSGVLFYVRQRRRS